MKIRGLKDEDFVNYHKASMFIGCMYCDWKCCTEQKLDKSICQNALLINSNTIDMEIANIFLRYITNPITKAIVIGGLEPFLQYSDIYDLIFYFRSHECNDDIVIYTGYYKEEIHEQIKLLQQFNNVIVKFGRYISNQKKHFDEVLGVYLASENQYAEKIS